MTNEQYLVASYAAVGALCVGLAAGVYRWLRGSFAEIVRAVSSAPFARILRGLFPLGILLPALLGFVSVAFYSCQRDTYGKIIQDRAYLVAKNQEQISTSLVYVAAALFVWGALVAVMVCAMNRRSPDR